MSCSRLYLVPHQRGRSKSHIVIVSPEVDGSKPQPQSASRLEEKRLAIPAIAFQRHSSLTVLTFTSTSGLYNSDLFIINMSAAAGRMASKVGGAAKAAGKAAAQSGDQKAGFLQKGARRDPELYVGSDSI